MRIKSNSSGDGKDFERPSVGGHQALLVRIDDIGEQHKKAFQDEPAKVRPQYVLTWELDQVDSKGTPFTLHSVTPQTLAGGTNRLRQIAEALLRHPLSEKDQENGFDSQDILGLAAYLHVVAGKDDDTKRYINRVDPIQGEATIEVRGRYSEEPRFVAYMVKKAVTPPTMPPDIFDPIPF